MSEETTTTTEVSVEAESSAPARPEWLPEKFETGEAMAKSYGELESMLGTRVSELGPDAKRALAALAPDEIKATLREQLASDEEFLGEIRSKWQQEQPVAPDEYAMPESLDLDTETYGDALSKLQEMAKGFGLSQEGYEQLLQLGAELVAPPAPLEDRMREFGPDFEQRAQRIVTMAMNRAGSNQAAVKAALSEIHSPEALAGLEAMLLNGQEKPISGDTRGTAEPQITQAYLDEMQKDPRYWRDKDPAWHAKVAAGYKQLYGDVI